MKCLCGCEKEVKEGNKYINGHNHPKHSEDFKRRLSERQKGFNNISKRYEVKEKMKNAKLINPTKYWLGKHRSEEDKIKISLSTKGRISPRLGKTHTQETKDKLSILKSKQTSDLISSGRLFNGNSKYRGKYTTKYGNTIYYQSYYEYKAIKLFEMNNEILNVERCDFSIKINERKHYIPDFKIFTKDNIYIVEVKPKKLIPYNQIKIKNLIEYCNKNSYIPLLLTEKELNITTKECSACGNKQDMPLWKRQYECSECGLSLDRDTNSAIIILRRALEQGSAEIDKCLSMKQEALTST